MLTVSQFQNFCRKCATYAPEKLGNVKAILKVVTSGIQHGAEERLAVEAGLARLRQHGFARAENGQCYGLAD